MKALVLVVTLYLLFSGPISLLLATLLSMNRNAKHIYEKHCHPRPS